MISIEKIAQMFNTFETYKELEDYFELFAAEEKQMLYMGAFFMYNYLKHGTEQQEFWNAEDLEEAMSPSVNVTTTDRS